MAYLGRHQLGNTMPVTVLTVDASNLPTAPDVPPVMKIWSGTTLILSAQMPVADRYGTSTNTTLFIYPLFLGASYAAGLYDVSLTWKIGTFVGVEDGTFEILAGGNADGSIIAMTLYRRPEADFVVWQTNSGKLQRGRGPKL